MKTSHTFTILFWINKSRIKNEKAELYARITVNGKRTNIGLKLKIDLERWDNKTKKAVGHSPESRKINNHIELVRSRLFNIYQELKYNDELITAQLIKNKYNGEDENSKTLQDIIEYHKGKIERTLTAGTIRNFGITENYINRYLQKKLKTNDIYLKQLNYKFISDFETFLSGFYPAGHPKALGHNTVMKHIQRLRKIITLAFHLEWIEKDPFKRWKSTFEPSQREFLSAYELSNLETYDFRIDRLDKVRDLFIFSCYTGISYSDTLKLNNDNIVIGIDGSKWIMTRRQKTGSPVKIPLLEKAEFIINKYKSHPVTEVSNTLLPVVPSLLPFFDAYTFSIFRLCGAYK